MKWQQAYQRTKANKITRVTTSERGQKNLEGKSWIYYRY